MYSDRAEAVQSAGLGTKAELTLFLFCSINSWWRSPLARRRFPQGNPRSPVAPVRGFCFFDLHRGHMHPRHILEPNHMHPQTHNMKTEEDEGIVDEQLGLTNILSGS